MSDDPRREAQARADQILAFRRELDRLAADDVVALTPDQERAVRGYHDRTLARLTAEFDVDRSERGGQLSRGLRIASALGGAALVATVAAFVHRYWGYLSMSLQVTVLTAFPLLALAGTQMAAERERSRYVAGLFALTACGTAWFAIWMTARLLDLPPTSLLLWPSAAFGIAVAASYGFRLVFALSLALFVVASASVFFAAGGVPWPTLFERLEPLAGSAFVLLAVARRLSVAGPGFDTAARLTGLTVGVGSLLVLANVGGTSLLAYAPETSQVVYQVLFVPMTVGLLWRALRGGETAAANLLAAALGLFLVIRYTDWFWDRLPAWAFFLVLAGVAFGSIAALRRARRRLEDA